MRLPSPRLVLLVMLGCGCGGGGGGGSGGTTRPAVAPTPQAPGAGCVQLAWKDQGQHVGEATYEGKLEQIEAGLPNGQTEKPFILSLDRPVCLPPDSDVKETDAIQVYSSDPALDKQLAASVGKRVTVTGEGFSALTAHHHRPVVIEVKRVTAR